jgi:cytochrome P450
MSLTAGSCLFREVPNNEAVIDGQILPGGSNIGVGIYSIHHSPIYFPDPFAYRPERWIVRKDNTTQDSLEKGFSVLNPFSLGSRSCVGKSLAKVELQLTLALVLHRYDIKLAEGDPGRIGEGRLNGSTAAIVNTNTNCMTTSLVKEVTIFAISGSAIPTVRFSYESLKSIKLSNSST